MPFLRFTRDRRGYENTFVVHNYRRHGKSQPQVLYWFRTPPNVKVGRPALDEGAIRSIEESNPKLLFDWEKMLKARGTSQPSETGKRRARREGRTGSAGARKPVAARQPTEEGIDPVAAAAVSSVPGDTPTGEDAAQSDANSATGAVDLE